MDPFWAFARTMLKQRGLVALALCFATISAGGLGAGLLGVSAILKNVLPAPGEGPGQELPQITDALIVSARRASFGLIDLPPEWAWSMPQGRFTAVVWVVCALGVLTMIGAGANFLHQYCSLTVVARTIASVRRRAFWTAVHLPLRAVVVRGPTDVVSRVVYDTATLGQGLNALLSKAVAQVTKGIVSLVVAFLLDWRLAAVALVVAPLMGAIMKKLGKRIRRASKSALQSQAGLYRSAAEALGGLRVVKAYGAERIESARFHRINKEVVRQEMRVRTARALSSPLVETVGVFVLGGLALVATKAIIDNNLDPREFLLVFGALGMAAAQLKPLTGFLNDIQQASAAAGRLNELLDEPVEEGHAAGLPQLARHGKSIRLEDVTFSYPSGATPSVKNVTLEVKHGETVAFVGPNGSGKTTLLSLVARLFDPDAGRVLVDGVDIRGVSIRSLRSQIGVVTQDTVIFTGTIGWNIGYGNAEVTEERIREAARRARAEEFILARPDGYETMLGEGGTGLSGGQRQRLAIARAILRDPAILILDEATSMVDADSEAKIAEAIAEYVGQHRRTCLVVAHRLSTVRNADRIVVMNEGEIADIGRHEDLLTRCEVYRLIAHNQLM